MVITKLGREATEGSPACEECHPWWAGASSPPAEQGLGSGAHPARQSHMSASSATPSPADGGFGLAQLCQAWAGSERRCPHTGSCRSPGVPARKAGRHVRRCSTGGPAAERLPSRCVAGDSEFTSTVNGPPQGHATPPCILSSTGHPSAPLKPSPLPSSSSLLPDSLSLCVSVTLPPSRYPPVNQPEGNRPAPSPCSPPK